MRNDFEEGLFLAHSAKGTSWKKGVRYIQKVRNAVGKYIYFYTQAAYNAYLKNTSGARKNPDDKKAETIKNNSSQQHVNNGTKKINEMQQTNGLKAKGNTKEEKKANLEKNISDGEKEINKQIAKSTKSDSSKSKKDSNSSKKSKGSGSSGSSKKSKGSGSKGSSGSKDKAAKEPKEKAAKAAKEPKEKTAKTTNNTTSKTKERRKDPITMDSLKKIYGKKDEDVETHTMTASELKNKMLSKYDEGSYGYLMAGDKAFKWTISDGKFIIKDYDSDKEVSVDEYLKDAKEFKEFSTNKKKK